MTLDRIHNDYSNTYFCQVSKWGKDLSEEDAIKVGLLQKASELATKTNTQTSSKLATPPLKTPTKRRRTRNNNNTNKGSKPTNNAKEGIE